MREQSIGFTLLEVMIALFVVAIALGGVIKVVGNAANNVSRLDEKTFAQWVGLNQINTLRLNQSWPKLGKLTGKSEMASRKWRWLQKTIKTEDEKIRRVEIAVWNEADVKDSPPAVTVVGFLANTSAGE